MEILLQFLKLMVGALIGAVLSFALPIIIKNQYYRKRPSLIGMWKSRYQVTYLSDTPIIDEEVKVELQFGRLLLKNKKNPIGDFYEAYGKMIDRMHLVGHWHSNKPGAHAFGTFMFMIHPLGDLMYGYFIGPNDVGEQVYGTWILAKEGDDSEKRLLMGKELLKKMSKIICLSKIDP